MCFPWPFILPTFQFKKTPIPPACPLAEGWRWVEEMDQAPGQGKEKRPDDLCHGMVRAWSSEEKNGKKNTFSLQYSQSGRSDIGFSMYINTKGKMVEMYSPARVFLGWSRHPSNSDHLDFVILLGSSMHNHHKCDFPLSGGGIIPKYMIMLSNQRSGSHGGGTPQLCHEHSWYASPSQQRLCFRDGRLVGDFKQILGNTQRIFVNKSVTLLEASLNSSPPTFN